MPLRPRLSMIFRRPLPLAMLTLFALASCEKEDGGAPTTIAQLETRWQLVRIDNASVAASGSSNTNSSYLEFVGLGSCTVGLGPCNNFSGRYTLGHDGQQLRISPQISTRATCPAQSFETQYLNNLALTERYTITGNELRLYDAASETPRLVFQQMAQ